MELSSALQLLFFMLLIPLFLFLFLFFYRNTDNKKKAPSAGLKTYPLLGNLPQFIQNRHRFLDWSTEVIARTPTHTMGIQIPGQVCGIVIANPLNVEHVLKTNFENYPKGERTLARLHDFFGRGIFNADGDHWKWQRKTASFEFSKRSLRNFTIDAVHREIAHRLLPLLKKLAAGEAAPVVDLQGVLERFAFDNICQVAFNADPACLTADGAPPDKASSGFMRAFAEAQDLVVGRFHDALRHSWRVKKVLDVGSEKRLREAISVIDSYLLRLIRSRKEKPDSDENVDLLSRFASNPESDDVFLRDVAVSFITAGRETTSSALTWFFWVLSTRPDVEEKIVEEIRSVRARRHRDDRQGETPPGFEELREMQYLHAAVTESMRLYPPVPIDTMSCRADDTMPDGTFVGEGWFVTYSQYAMGRSAAIWGEDCGEYRPERWLDGGGAFRPESPFRYPVFHAGPRMCLGKDMAYIQMKSVAACVLERFRIRVVGKEGIPEHVLSLTLRMKGGLPIQVKNRDDAVG